MTETLTKDDVALLTRKASAEVRAGLASKIARVYDEGRMRAHERRLAEDIFRLFMADEAEAVRVTLAERLKATSRLPNDIARGLADDCDAVALPILRFSEALLDGDLLDAAKLADQDRLIAMTQRHSISPVVVGALIEIGDEALLLRLLDNAGAELDDLAISQILHHHGTSDSVLDALARRPDLPRQGARSLIDSLLDQLEAGGSAGVSAGVSAGGASGELSGDQLCDLVLRICRVCASHKANQAATEDSLTRLVDILHDRRSLTPSLILRAVCLGDMKLFELAMAKRADISLKKAKALIHDKGTLGLESIILRAGMPDRLLPAIQVAVEVADETHYDGGQDHRARYLERMLERILEEFEDPGERIPEEDIVYLLDRLQQCAA